MNDTDSIPAWHNSPCPTCGRPSLHHLLKRDEKTWTQTAYHLDAQEHSWMVKWQALRPVAA